MAGKAGPVNEIRQVIRADCLAASKGSPGLYRLTAPTGSGKTLSAMAFALAHATRHGMDRVIYAAPFVNVTSQTSDSFRNALAQGADTVSPTEQAADSLRAALGGHVVLEHHSDAPWRREEDGGTKESQWAVWSKLASENWDAPVVVTTTVQLLESIFSNRPGKCRKNHRMANAVIVLDEPQAIPHHVIEPSIDALRSLASHYRSTVVLATATQPAFDSIPAFRDFCATDIVQQPEKHTRELQRVSYDWGIDQERSWSAIASEMLVAPGCQGLAIVNTRRNAESLLRALRDAGASDPLLLSTRLCGDHRRRVVRSVRERLVGGKPCLLVSTQIVEAGVDLDFPALWREFAPLPSVEQASGRCNREGKLRDCEGNSMAGAVTIFLTSDSRSSVSAVYGVAADVTRKLVSSSEFDHHLPSSSMARYFEDLFGLLDPGGGLDRESIQTQRRNGKFAYSDIAKDFRLIEDHHFPVAVTSLEGGQAVRDWLRNLDRIALDPLAGSPGEVRMLRRKVQPYLVNLWEWEFGRAEEAGLTGELGSAAGFPEWRGEYDAVAGLVPAP